MRRRAFLSILTGTVLGMPSQVNALTARSAGAGQSLGAIRNNWKSLLAPDAEVAVTTDHIRRSNDEWRKLLTDAQYRVLRQEATERAFSSPLNDEKRPGVYVCAGCTLPLFTSQMKFDSRTGWPSFFTHIPRHLDTKRDFQLLEPRIEYHCIRCGGHQGHVFDDGPLPTRERWCNNGVALGFIAATGQKGQL